MTTSTGNKKCDVANCDLSPVTRGYCGRHYHRLVRYGDPEGRPPLRPRGPGPLARIMRAVTVDPETDCWVCDLGVGETGYAYVSDGRGQPLQRAHRVTYEYFVGPIPDGLQLDHVKARGCRYRNCVNPAHLEPVTQAENLRRGDSPAMIAARTNVCQRGHSDWVTSGSGRRTCRTCKNERRRATT